MQHYCDYDWKDSHWASRSERELREICERPEIPGWGPKAARIKRPETVALDYEDMYMSSPEDMCRQRGLRYNGLQRLELAQKLREDDAARDGDVAGSST